MFQRIARLFGCLLIATLCACGAEKGSGATGTVDSLKRNDAASGDSSITVTDDGGRLVHLARPAHRIVSLVPSITETLVAIGAKDRLVGRTRYDEAPELANVPSVGGGIDPSIEAIVAQRPDLVLLWQSEKRGDVAAKLSEFGIPYFAFRTEDTTDVFRSMASLGKLTGRDSAAIALAARVRKQFDAVKASVAARPRKRVMYVVFNDPPMTAGPGTFVAQLVSLAGGQSIFEDVKLLWPNVSMEEIVGRDPDIIVLPVGEFRSNAVATLRTKAGWRDVRAVKEGRIAVVSSNLLGRPGPSIGDAAEALRNAIHPEVGTGR